MEGKEGGREARVSRNRLLMDERGREERKGGGGEDTYHLDLGQGLGAVLHQVFNLAGVDADHAQEEVAGDAKGEGGGGMNDGVWREGGREGGREGWW